MMQLIPVEEIYVESLQVKHLIINWAIHTEGQRTYWKIIRLGGSSVSYQFFVDLLKHFDKEDLNQLWALVKESLIIRPATSNKEKELWVELKGLYEPHVEDKLWAYTQTMMHAPVEWKLYDTYRVHHLISKDQEMFMLVEKDYPLRKGLAIVMISYKLQVENYSQMSNDLILKIHKIANSIPTASDKFPLPVYIPTSSKDMMPLLSQRDATAEEVCAAEEDKPSSNIDNNSDDLQNRNSSVTETGESSSTILSKPVIKFVKAAKRPTEIKTNKVETLKKPAVKYAELYRKTSKSSNRVKRLERELKTRTPPTKIHKLDRGRCSLKNRSWPLIEPCASLDYLLDLSSCSKMVGSPTWHFKEVVEKGNNLYPLDLRLVAAHTKDSYSLWDEINLSLTLDDSMPSGIENDDYDSEGDMLILENLLSNGSLSLPKNESFYFDIPSSLRPPAKPPDDDEIKPNSEILTVKVVGDISKHYVPIPRLFPTQPTLASNQEKYPHLLSHQDFKTFQLPSESPMMIYGGNTPILDVLFLQFYPP
nr:hypothetical protein [Tanacetum cinerariifolium]